MAESLETLVRADLRAAAAHWRAAGRRDLDAEAIDAAVRGDRGRPGPDVARFAMVTKGPHLVGPVARACVVARLRAFGVTVLEVRRADGRGADLARALYPRAFRYFDHGPTVPPLWERLARRFDNDAFTSIFGHPYKPEIVRPGARVLADNGLDQAELTRIWEQGRQPITREGLRPYGSEAAGLVLGGAESYAWFRGDQPIGIHRIASGLTAFALRDGRLYDSDPVIVVNGHVPGLADLFTPEAWIFDLGLAGDLTIGDVREFMVGDDSLPSRCRPGTLRRDGFDHTLGGVDPALAVTSRHNLIHCSDGLLAGRMETRSLGPERAGPDLLATELLAAGLTEDEIGLIVEADPRVRHDEPNGHLTDVTKGLGLKETVEEILRYVPPVLGASNGHADGVTRSLLEHVFGGTPLDLPAVTPPESFPVTPGHDDRAAGLDVLTGGQVAMLVPAGGTGGRFGGYDVPESHTRRQKALAPILDLDGRAVSALDIRMANVRFWDRSARRRMPVAVMGSATGAAALHDWRSRLDEPYRTSVCFFRQHGVYRVDRDLLAESAGRPWVDAILRDGRGVPSRKPHGSMGLFSALVVSGQFDRWAARGVRYLVMANADDVLFRIDPGTIGHLERNATVDAVVHAVPWAYSAGQGDTVVRGDEEGWTSDRHGRPLATAVPEHARRYDRGGALRIRDRRLSVAEGAWSPGAVYSTNRIYVRVEAIRRVLGTDGPERVARIGRLLAGLPAHAEDKTVLVDGEPRPVRQLGQPLNGLLYLLGRCDVRLGSRLAGDGYAALKVPEDVRFAQLGLEQPGMRDELALAPEGTIKETRQATLLLNS
jgi:hypothetical protein